jgi:hypothetical protein
MKRFFAEPHAPFHRVPASPPPALKPILTVIRYALHSRSA